MRDVSLYLTQDEVRDAVNAKVRATLSPETKVIVGHSLGSVVAYDVLMRNQPGENVRSTYLTVGSPLGLSPIRDALGDLGNPAAEAGWANHYDERDIVALHPLDGRNFPVEPTISNDNSVRNHTDNRHGIAGYLDDPRVAAAIHTGLTGGTA